MTDAKHSDVAWLRGERGLGLFWSLAFVQGISEIEALQRMGGQSISPRVLNRQQLINEGLLSKVMRVARFESWIVVIEMNDCRLMDFVNSLSTDTEAILVFENINAWSGFHYIIDGELETAFDPLTPDWREGRNPDRFVEIMRETGFDPDEENIHSPGVVGALALASKITGAILTPNILDGPLISAQIR